VGLGPFLPGVAHTNDMVYITQAEFEQLVGKDAGGIGKAKQRVVGEDGAEAHGSGMEDSLMAKVA